MKHVSNKFGAGILYESHDLNPGIYCVCTACMSVWSDFLSYASKDPYIVSNKYIPERTRSIVVLGCQVTDLAVYNDLKTAEELHQKYPDIPIYMGGCLAQRFDVELPPYLKRLDVVREIYQEITYTNAIEWKKPFWNKDLKEDDDEFETGNLFRHSYPLKIGAGCHGGCSYCTIRDTRGASYTTDAYLQVREFLNHDNVVLICDNPDSHQIIDWCHLALRYDKPISLRNVEPITLILSAGSLVAAAQEGLLSVLHCPIQSMSAKVLKEMNRDATLTRNAIELMKQLRNLGVKIATNIIIDYPVDGELVHNMPEEILNSTFDYWSWNPYWAGVWDYETAEKRFKKYIG